MNKLLVVLACVVSLAAAGILDRSSVGLGDRGTDRILSMTQDELLRQKFLLDILLHVQQPMINEELLELGKTMIVDQEHYDGQIDDEMLHIMELCRSHRLLGRQEVFTITDEDHLRQMVGLYRILVRSRDWDTFQRNTAFARMHINGVLLVNSLLLAVRDRHDTRALIIPAIHEILPELFWNENLVRRAKNIDINMMITDTQSRKPGLIDMIGMQRRQRLEDRQMGLLDRTQLWMPWREMRMEMAMRRATGEQTKMLLRHDDKLVLPVENQLQGDARMSLLTEDVGLNGFLYNLINDLILNEHEMQRGDLREQRLGINQQGSQMDRSIRREEDDDEQDMRRNGNTEIRGTTNDMNRILRVGRRRQNMNINNDMENERWEQRPQIVDGRRIIDQHEDIMQHRQKMNWMRGNELNEHRMRQSDLIDQHEDIMQQRQQMNWMRGNELNEHRMRQSDLIDIDQLPTTTINDQRLLHINRRHMQSTGMQGVREHPNMVIGMANQRQRFLNIVRGTGISDGRRIVERDQDIDMDMDMELDMNSARRTTLRDKILNMRRSALRPDQMQRQRQLQNTHMDEDDVRMGSDIGIGRRGEETWTQRNGMQRQNIDNIREREWMRSGTIDELELPTTTIDDERLLHVNRRHLNWNMQANNADDRQSMRRRQQVVERNVDHADDMDRMNRMEHNRNMNLGMNEQRNRIQNQQRNDNMQQMNRNNMDEERLLHANRRRLINHNQHEQIENMQDNFLGMVQRGIRDGRSIIERDDDDNWRVKYNLDNERMQNTNRRWGQVGERVEMVGAAQRRMQNNNMRGMEHIGERWDREQNLNTWDNLRQMSVKPRLTDDELAMMGRQSGMNERRMIDNDRLLVTGRRRAAMNNDDTIASTRHRVARSLRTDMLNDNHRMMQKLRGGELLLHNLQQLMARMNMERISLGINDVEEDDKMSQRGINNQRLTMATGERYALRLNDMRMDTRRQRLMLEQINNIEERLQQAISQQMRNVSMRNKNDVDRMIGELLQGKMQGIGILQLVRELLLQTRDTQQNMHNENMQGMTLIRCPIMQHLLRRIVKIVDLQRQQLGGYKRNDIMLPGVRVNNVDVDQLRTFIDANDADLINLLDQRLTLQRDQVLQKMVVARQQRLNHKSFTINIDLTADRDQRVVLRTMLLPKIDANGRTLQLEEARLNSLLLDATIVDLRAGNNMIRRKSRDINWTIRDATPLTEIYQRVMQAIEGKLELQLDQVVGNNCRLPHRLLLPRGRIEGLPMQLLVVVTPLEEGARNWQQENREDERLCGMGISSLNMDQLPLGFPMDRKIEDVEQLINLPNLQLKDVTIYHDDKLSNRI